MRKNKYMIKAVIFDKDGVIIDAEKLQYQAFLYILKDQKRTLSFNEYLDVMSGRRTSEQMVHLFGNKLNGIEKDNLSKKHYDFFSRAIRKKIPYVKGIKEFLRELKKSHLLIGMATSSRKKNVDIIIDDLREVITFDAITHGDEVEYSKPNPDVFLVTANKLKVLPNECFVFEDSLAGVAAAKAAGMRVGFVTTSHPAGTVSGVDLTIPDFTHLTPADVL